MRACKRSRLSLFSTYSQRTKPGRIRSMRSGILFGPMWCPLRCERQETPPVRSTRVVPSKGLPAVPSVAPRVRTRSGLESASRCWLWRGRYHIMQRDVERKPMIRMRAGRGLPFRSSTCVQPEGRWRSTELSCDRGRLPRVAHYHTHPNMHPPCTLRMTLRMFCLASLTDTNPSTARARSLPLDIDLDA